MTRLYKICGMNVSCDFRYATMTQRAEKYLTESGGSAEITVAHSESELRELMAAQPHLSLNECEIIKTATSFYTQLLLHGGFMLHSSAVEYNGGAYLFSAASGTGKSTHTSLWLKEFSGARIINDDKPAILLKESGVFACGTPWSGKSDLNLPVCVPLKGICILTRSENNYIEPLAAEDALFPLLDQTVRPKDEEKMSLLLEMLGEVIEQVGVWKMGCNISAEAAKMAYAAMSGE